MLEECEARSIIQFSLYTLSCLALTPEGLMYDESQLKGELSPCKKPSSCINYQLVRSASIVDQSLSLALPGPRPSLVDTSHTTQERDRAPQMSAHNG